MQKVFLKFAFILLLVFTIVEVDAYELTLYTMPPPRDLDWSSPRALGLSVLNNKVTTITHLKAKHVIGHVFIELKGPDFWELTGSTTAADAPSDSDYILKKGYGLGAFFADFKGDLDSAEKLKKELEERYKTGRVAYIRFLISPKTFVRLKTYLTEYKARGYHKIYNGLNRPRAGKGAGCSAFGISFLELAGILHPIWERTWVRKVLIPEEFIGGPLTGKFVSFKKTLLSSRWAKEGEPSRLLVLYDPELIYKWIVATWEKLHHASLHENNVSGYRDSPHSPKLEKRGKALGIVYDCRDVPTPTDPIWQTD